MHMCVHARLRAHPLDEPMTIWISRVMLWQIFVRLHFYTSIFRCKWQVVFKAHTLALLRFFSINLMFYHLQIKFIVSKCANRHLCAVCAPLMASKVFLLTITWGVLSQMPPFQTPDSQSAPRGQSSSLGGRSPALRPLGALPWCSFSRGVTQEGPNARQGSGVWDDGDKEPEKVKEDGKCFEWVKRRRDEGERRRARMRRRESGCARLTTKGEKRERDQWRGCISGTSQANYPAPSPPFPSFFCSHFSLTFFGSALTIHVLSTARDP